jgi:hypothetical protein
LAALEEIRVTSAPTQQQADRAALRRLDVLIGKLEDLNLRGITQVPLQLNFEIARAMDGLLSEGVAVPDCPSRALDLLFAGQARLLRGLYPEFRDEFDDE